MGVARGVLRRIDDSTTIQTVQTALLAGEVRSAIERFQEYGFSSVPFEEAEVVVVFPGGNRDHGLGIACEDRRYRLKSLAPGEVALYDDLGKTIIFRRDGRLEIRAAEIDVQTTGDATIQAGGDATVRATGNATLDAGGIANVTGATINLTATAAINLLVPLVDIQGKGDYQAHVHANTQPNAGTNSGPVL